MSKRNYDAVVKSKYTGRYERLAGIDGVDMVEDARIIAKWTIKLARDFGVKLTDIVLIEAL